MRPVLKACVILVLVGVAAMAAALAPILRRGISARDEPTEVETVLARWLRRLAIPRGVRVRSNPVQLTSESLKRARAHFADHCASCHGNDGKGETDLGRTLYPRAPDMTLADTQGLSDGEIFAIIEGGVRLSGMPAWGKPSPEDDADGWELVHFIRHLPQISAEELAEMESLNPKGRKELEEEESIRRFLSGEDIRSPETNGEHKH
jgi:mono/diheme cytochrome c family protein